MDRSRMWSLQPTITVRLEYVAPTAHGKDEKSCYHGFRGAHRKVTASQGMPVIGRAKAAGAAPGRRPRPRWASRSRWTRNAVKPARWPLAGSEPTDFFAVAGHRSRATRRFENLENWPRGKRLFWHRPSVMNMTGRPGRPA